MVCKYLNLTRQKCLLKYYSDLHYYTPTKMPFLFKAENGSRTLDIWHWLYIILEDGDMDDIVNWLTRLYWRSLIICQYVRRQIASSFHSFLVLHFWLDLPRMLENFNKSTPFFVFQNIEIDQRSIYIARLEGINTILSSSLIFSYFQALCIFNHKILQFCYSPNTFFS